MATNVDGQHPVVVVEPTGYLDVPAAQAFEQQTLDLLDGGARIFVIGFARVNLITSAGIRVLVELRQRLQPHQGALVLYGLNERVKTVFSVTGLIERFRIVGSKEDAMREVETYRASVEASRTKLSSLTRLVGRVLGTADGSTAHRVLSADGSGKSALATEITHLLDECGAGGPS